MTRFKTVFTGVIVVAGIVASLQIQRRTRAQLRDNEALLRQRENQLAELAAEKQRLSNRVVQLKGKSTTPEDRTGELAQLRAKIEALRQQTNQLAKQVAENRRLAGVQFFSQGDFDLLEHNKGIGGTSAGGPRAAG